MLNNIEFKAVYASGENEPVDFFFDALIESTSFDLGLGFFSSSAIRSVAPGFAYFLANGGRMRVIINDILSEEDKNAIIEGFSIETLDIEEKFLSNFKYLTRNLSAEGKHFFKCLSFLIASRRIDFRATIPIASHGGIVHQKFGIFKDLQKNKLVFSGSSNFSKTAFFENMETISCYCSWTNNTTLLEYIQYYEDLFEKIWNDEFPKVKLISFDKVRTHILTDFPVNDVQGLLEENKKMYLEHYQNYNLSETLLAKISMLDLTPKFPFPTGPREYQMEAYRSWVSNNYQGIFAMATGTGKTITSLNCVLEEYKESHSYHILILLPYLALLDQWIDEVGKFNYQNIIEVSGRTNWREKLTKVKNDFIYGIKQNFVIISTYDSFPNADLQNLLKKLPDDIIVIADEAHNIGSINVRTAFQGLKFHKRIALSATPKRNYDEEGTKAIELLFNDKPPYCYNFDMERAIAEGCLTHYLYYPRLVYLQDEEMERYSKLSNRLLMYFDGKQLRKCPEVEKLLLIRKQIIHKAIDKYRALKLILSEIKKEREIKYCFVYVPEGVQKNDGIDEQIVDNMSRVIQDECTTSTFNTYLGGDPYRSDKLKGFANGDINILLAKKCLDEGVDVPRAEIGIFASSTGNPRQFIQRRGRLLRKHSEKNYARIYDMVVGPDFHVIPRDSNTYKIERSLIKNELTRVAYFASLADNYSESYLTLKEICDYYRLSLDVLIKELK